ncbi:polar amino acid transport system permease protein [Paucidesulfovibrio gracilis DSM 16080]|uniref:Polar amino acid transport system permease protein n=1 Tax=Paucidesulfovibrio gracilis DSM 16080 TaxID=1121449 RepID=A0A1T4WIX9_9BACT|nr:amino acid ABC transporter permease [Paucidesulfovibrio gracilis]SKA77119.1 polar amino acid transport system permease protein [Paucidesulfovibrio gracilis DSM 16080]
MQYQFDWIATVTGEPGRWLWEGFVTTIEISFIGIVFAMLLGIAICVLRMTRFKPFVWFSVAYTEFFRNTPLLVQIFFWYFGAGVILPEALNDWINQLYYWFPGPFAFGGTEYTGEWMLFSSESMSVVIALAVYTSAFIAEELRAGIFSIPKNQLEASRATGLTFLQSYRYVILPQAIRIVVPPLISQFLNLIKNSSLAMALGVTELTYQATQIESYHGLAFEGFTVATLIYLIISLVVSLAINMYNKHFMLQVKY